MQLLFREPNLTFLAANIDQANETGALYTLDSSTTPIKRYTAQINDFTQDKIIATLSHEYRPELLAEDDQISDFVVNNNESIIYAISPTSEHISFDGTVFTDNGLLPQTEGVITIAVDKSKNNFAHYVRFDSAIGFLVNVYNEQAELTSTFNTGGQQPTSIDISADDKRLLVNATNSTQVEMITLEQFDVSATQLSFNTTFGNASVETQEVIISGVSDSWQATSDVAWLSFTQETTEDSNTLTITVDSNEITGWGLFTGIVTITDPETGSNTQIVIELAVDEVRLFSEVSALTFTEQVDKTTLSHTVSILTNKASAVEWQANSNVDWLTLVTDSVNNTLTLTADPSKISADGFYQGEITLSPTNSAESLSGIIKVSFDKGDFDTTSMSEIVIADITPNNTSDIVLDPLRPNIYIAQGDTIKVHNIITGALITTITSPLADVDLTNLVIHPDGSILLASNSETFTDEDGQSQTRVNHYQIDLSNFSISLMPADDIDLEFRPAQIAMISGKAIVISEALEYANLALKLQFWDRDNAFDSPFIKDVPANNNVVAYNSNTAALMQYTLEYNAFTSESVQQVASAENINPAFSGALSNIVTSSSGEDIYTASTTSEWTIFDGITFADQGVLRSSSQTVNVAIDSSNNSYFYRFDSGFFMLSKYDENQQELFTATYSAGSADSYISPNYQRVIHYDSTSNSLVLDYIPD